MAGKPGRSGRSDKNPENARLGRHLRAAAKRDYEANRDRLNPDAIADVLDKHARVVDDERRRKGES